MQRILIGVKYLELIFYRRIPNELLDFYLENNFLSKLKIIFNKLVSLNQTYLIPIQLNRRNFAYYFKINWDGFIF